MQKSIRIKPQGYSMYPLIVPGRDEVVVEYTDPAVLKRGDIVLFRREGSILVLHRICRRQGDDFYMVGDNQKVVEGPIKSSQIRGKVTVIIRKGRAIPVNHLLYRLCSHAWLLFRPFRPMISRIVHKAKMIFSENDGGRS